MASTTSTSSPDLSSSPPSDHRSPWSPQTSHANNHSPETNGHASPPSPSTPSSPTPLDPSKSPAAISLRAFLLGVTLSTSLLLTTTLLLHPSPLWRLPFFLSSLSLFHYLEYQTTALYNPSSATVSAFLLSQNGRAYNIAHGCAFLECGIRWYFYPEVHMASPALQMVYLAAGFIMMVVGQAVRTTAMAHAGANFSHLVQNRKKEGHVLVTGGVYGWLRHPSYFGFFWWGIGSQIVLGNGVCLVGYAVVLWRFFRMRMEKEETLLIGFFGMEYVRYRERTRVGIPLIP